MIECELCGRAKTRHGTHTDEEIWMAYTCAVCDRWPAMISPASKGGEVGHAGPERV